jgi:signal recognition particle GTPase
MRIARGAGRPIRDVMEMWEEYTSDLLRSGAK